MQRKWNYRNEEFYKFIVDPEGDQRIIATKADEHTLAFATAALTFTDDMPLSRLEAAPDTAKNLLNEAWSLLDAYLSEIDYQLQEVDHDADEMAFWQADQERVMAYMKKIEPLTNVTWFIRGDEGADEA